MARFPYDFGDELDATAWMPGSCSRCGGPLFLRYRPIRWVDARTYSAHVCPRAKRVRPRAARVTRV